MRMFSSSFGMEKLSYIGDEFRYFERFGKTAMYLHRRWDSFRVRTDKQKGQLRSKTQNLNREFRAGHLRHDDISEQQGYSRWVLLKQRQRLSSVFRFDDSKALSLEYSANQVAY